MENRQFLWADVVGAQHYFSTGLRRLSHHRNHSQERVLGFGVVADKDDVIVVVTRTMVDLTGQRCTHTTYTAIARPRTKVVNVQDRTDAFVVGRGKNSGGT